MKDLIKPLIDFLTRLKCNNNFNEGDTIEIDHFLFELKSIYSPNKFDINKCKKTVVEIIKWAGITDQVIKDIIDICTHHK